MTDPRQPDLFDCAVPTATLAGPPPTTPRRERPPSRGRQDAAPHAADRETLWPECVADMSREERERLYGDIPQKTRLTVKEVCRRLQCDSNHVYRLIFDGTLSAANIARKESTRPIYRIYRWSLVGFLHNRREGDNG